MMNPGEAYIGNGSLDFTKLSRGKLWRKPCPPNGVWPNTCREDYMFDLAWTGVKPGWHQREKHYRNKLWFTDSKPWPTCTPSVALWISKTGSQHRKREHTIQGYHCSIPGARFYATLSVSSCFTVCPHDHIIWETVGQEFLFESHVYLTMISFDEELGTTFAVKITFINGKRDRIQPGEPARRDKTPQSDHFDWSRLCKMDTKSALDRLEGFGNYIVFKDQVHNIPSTKDIWPLTT